MINDLMTTVFAEQALASPRSAKYKVASYFQVEWFCLKKKKNNKKYSIIVVALNPA